MIRKILMLTAINLLFVNYTLAQDIDMESSQYDADLKTCEMYAQEDNIQTDEKEEYIEQCLIDMGYEIKQDSDISESDATSTSM